MLKFKRSQSAVELLVTYGWVFILILGFIGALFYLDLLNFIGVLPDECEFSSEIECKEKFLVSSSAPGNEDGSVYLTLDNNLGASVRIDECYLRVPGVEGDDGYFCADAQGSCGTGEHNLSGEIWQQGENMFFNFSQCDTASVGLREGMKHEVFMTFQYNAVGSSPDSMHNITGRVFTRVERAR